MLLASQKKKDMRPKELSGPDASEFSSSQAVRALMFDGDDEVRFVRVSASCRFIS